MKTRNNGNIGVDLRLLRQVYKSLQSMLVEYHGKDSVAVQDQFYAYRRILVPVEWVLPQEYNKGKFILLVRLIGEDLWKNQVNEHVAAAAGLLNTDPLKAVVMFRARVEPDHIEHELVHIIQIVRRELSKYTGVPTKGRSTAYSHRHKSMPKGTEVDKENSFPDIEFYPYIKNVVLLTLSDTTNRFERSNKKQKYKEKLLAFLQEGFTNHTFESQWDILLGLFKQNFASQAYNTSLKITQNQMIRQKFIALCYEAAYEQLVLYARQHRVKGAPNSTPHRV